eukprot:6174504-Pleurochrysis_carterae.AAC.1
MARRRSRPTSRRGRTWAATTPSPRTSALRCPLQTAAAPSTRRSRRAADPHSRAKALLPQSLSVAPMLHPLLLIRRPLSVCWCFSPSSHLTPMNRSP